MDADPGIQRVALESLGNEIRTATSSMTSIPKPIKFLRPQYPALKEYYVSLPDVNENKVALHFF
jgi:26S proteasome regulatory subunit N1